MSGHSTIVGEVKIRMVVTPYLSGLNTIIEWHTVVSLPCTILGSAVICLKESDLVVTQPGRTSRRLNMVDSREVDSKQVVVGRSVAGLMRLCYLMVVKADEVMNDIATADNEIEGDGTLVVTT
ncbi:hypothetical protein MTR_5g031010 [Medicago truncatula]|uniref:Uncharacterized protein n=1 Tax=Medicago truncatula TaxID=3880 RepID=G7KGG3_MEDTR|nr:hypothetical protein MTR_5g031010 [Medicago truncatula]